MTASLFTTEEYLNKIHSKELKDIESFFKKKRKQISLSVSKELYIELTNQSDKEDKYYPLFAYVRSKYNISLIQSELEELQELLIALWDKKEENG